MGLTRSERWYDEDRAANILNRLHRDALFEGRRAEKSLPMVGGEAPGVAHDSANFKKEEIPKTGPGPANLGRCTQADDGLI